jgi:hypothetical protein
LSRNSGENATSVAVGAAVPGASLVIYRSGYLQLNAYDATGNVLVSPATYNITGGENITVKWILAGTTYYTLNTVGLSIRRPNCNTGCTQQTLSNSMSGLTGSATFTTSRTLTGQSLILRFFSGFNAVAESPTWLLLTAPSPSPSPSTTPSATSSASATASATASASGSASSSATATATSTTTGSPSYSSTPTPSISESPSPTPTVSLTPRPSGVSASPSPDYQKALQELAAKAAASSGPDTGALIGAIAGTLVGVGAALFAFQKYKTHKATQARLKKLKNSAEFARAGADRLYFGADNTRDAAGGAGGPAPNVVVTYSLVGNVGALKSSSGAGSSAAAVAANAGYKASGAGLTGRR